MGPSLWEMLDAARQPSCAPSDEMCNFLEIAMLTPGIGGVSSFARRGILAANVAKGRAAEDLVLGPAVPKRRIPSLTGTAPGRYPDRILSNVLKEVKNTDGLLRWTPQLDDYLLYSRATGREMELFVTEGATIHSDVVNKVISGEVTLRYYILP